MATYVISDLHGQYDYFIEILKLIDFNVSDYLYILGDVIDRGPDSLKIIDFIRENDNIHLIKGNHEEMLINYLEYPDQYSSIDFRLWLKNGGISTYRELLTRDSKYIKDLYTYLNNLPNYVVLDNFLLVHAGLYVDNSDNSLKNSIDNSDSDDFLWDRSFALGNSRVEGYTVICGHTPIQNFGLNKFYKRDGVIIIDCGCAGGLKPGCLRLDDLTEFYL